MKFYPTLDETLSKRFEPGTEDGVAELRDIVNHGMSGGVGGFIYYYEINEFYNEFEREIEDVMFDTYGDTWLSEVVGESENMQALRNTLVWSVVEYWAFSALQLVEEAVA